jgi:hypothetical protein
MLRKKTSSVAAVGGCTFNLFSLVNCQLSPMVYIGKTKVISYTILLQYTGTL